MKLCVICGKYREDLEEVSTVGCVCRTIECLLELCECLASCCDFKDEEPSFLEDERYG
jgi:hypothetical protein